MKLFKRTLSMAIALIMIISLIPTNIVHAAIGDSESNPISYNSSDKTNFPESPNEGYVLLKKTSEWIENEDNIAKVTMSLEGKGVQKKSDVVLVIDRSGSMNDKIRVYCNEIPVTFTANNVSYIYSTNQSNKYREVNNATATINMTAYVDNSGNFRGYKSGTLNVKGLDVPSASWYLYDRGWFDSWTSLDNTYCVDALLSIFEGKKAQVTIGNNLVNVTFPTQRSILRNTTNNYTYSNETKISAAKVAAKKFVSSLLSTKEMKTLNKIGIVSYSSSGYGNGEWFVDSVLSNNDTSLNTAIDYIVANGGTNIQAGILKAQEILNGSTADDKYIVVLSDGEPTFSYKATASTKPTAVDLALNYPSDISYKLTSFDTSSIVGSGSKYEYDGYWVHDIREDSEILSEYDNWYHNWYYNNYGYYNEYWYKYYYKYWYDNVYVTDNGIPTISQALIAKKAGIEMYSVGFDVAGNTNAIYTMKHVASSADNFYLASDDLSEVFTNIAGKIAKAGTNAKVNNSMGADIQLGYNFTVIKDASHPITTSQGSATVSTDLKSINWNLGVTDAGGDITETPAMLTYYIKLNVYGDKTIDTSAILNTSSSSSVVYKNYLGLWCEKNFPSSVLPAGNGMLNVKYYLTDKEGNPINSNGTKINFKDRVFVDNPFNQAAVLNSTIKVSDYAKNIQGFVNQSNIAKDENGANVAASIIATRATVYLNFPYYAQPTHNKLINNTMYPSKGVEPINSAKSPFNVVEKFDYTFGFKFLSGQDEPNINIQKSGTNIDTFDLSNFKLYEGSTLLDSKATLDLLDKTKIKAGNTYTITYSLKANIMNSNLSVKVIVGDDDLMTYDNGVANPISIISKTMPMLE